MISRLLFAITFFCVSTLAQFVPVFTSTTFNMSEGCGYSFNPCNQFGFTTPDRNDYEPPLDMFILRISNNNAVMDKDAYDIMWGNAESFITKLLNNISSDQIHAIDTSDSYYVYDCPIGGNTENIRMYLGTANSSYTNEFVQKYHEFADQYCTVTIKDDNSSVSTGAIVATVIGCAVVLCILGVCLYLCCNKNIKFDVPVKKTPPVHNQGPKYPSNTVLGEHGMPISRWNA